MTRDEAYNHSRDTGDKITHRHFSDHEWMKVTGNTVELEDGVKTTTFEMDRWRTDSSWNTDWSVYKL